MDLQNKNKAFRLFKSRSPRTFKEKHEKCELNIKSELKLLSNTTVRTSTVTKYAS